MSTGVVGTVRLNTYGESADTVHGTIVTIPSMTFDFVPPADAMPHRLANSRAVPAALIHKGDLLTLVVARRTSVGGNHAGDFRLIGATVAFMTSPISGFSAVTITEQYLGPPIYGNISDPSLLTGDVDYPLFGTTFDALVNLSSSTASGRIDASFPGRLTSGQTTISQLRINLFGSGASPGYKIKVYAEGSGATPVYDSSTYGGGPGTPQLAPGSSTEFIITDSMLSAQPTGQKRYHVVVEAWIDLGETIYASLPLARQE